MAIGLKASMYDDARPIADAAPEHPSRHAGLPRHARVSLIALFVPKRVVRGLAFTQRVNPALCHLLRDFLVTTDPYL